MSKTICTTIRNQLDEMMLGDEYGIEVSRHLAECNDCRDFQQKQTRLRQIISGLGTVAAPADFDFRLRARLANEKSASTFHLNRSVWSLSYRNAALAAGLLLVVGAVISVLQVANRNAKTTTALEGTGNSKVVIAEKTTQKSEESSSRPGDSQTVLNLSKASAPKTTGQQSNPRAPRVKPMMVAEDKASQRAPVIRGSTETSNTIFPIDTSQQSLKVSLFDGRGNPRTISVPSVTFGSQRVVPTASSFASKGVW